eukprot:s3004_g2.t1
MKRGKRGKRVPLSREAAQAFWACALHESHESPAQLPERFESATAYYMRLSNLVLAESKAVIAHRQRQGSQAAEATVTQLSSSACNKVAKHRGVKLGLVSWEEVVLRTGRLLSLTVNVPQAKHDWPTFRTAWLVELHPTSRNCGAPFFVERAATGRQDFSVDLCGFAPADWGWTDEHQNVLVEAPIRIRLRPLEDMVPMLRMWTACFIGPQVPFLHQLIGAKSATHRVFSDSEEEGMESEVPDVLATEMKESMVNNSDSMQQLNSLQQEAIRKILMDHGPPSRRCHLLQGPPGTGKTRAVVALLQQLSARQRSVVEPQSRILVSAPSNGAVQVALESFLKTQEGSEGQQSSLCLVGVEDRVPPTGPLRSAFIHTRLQYTLSLLQQSQKDSSMLPALESLESCLPSTFRRLKLPTERQKWASPEALQRIVDAKAGDNDESEESDGSETSTTRSESSEVDTGHRRHKPLRGSLLDRLAEFSRREKFGEEDFETEQLHSSSSVFCTLSCSGRPSLQTLRDTVHTVLVDEAAQAVEAETLIPLCLRPKQLVLVGDPNQLSATVCHSESAKSAKFCRSMMERLMALGQDYIMLQEQYRMHPEISRFPSQRFYGGRLIDVTTTSTEVLASRPSPGGVYLPPYAVVNVAGREEENRRRGQILNRREAESLVSFARKLTNAEDGLVKAEDGRHQGRAPEVVVITFYSGQAALIRQLLGEVKIAVHTVDSFQGSEADVVLLSFVRANARRRLGFLSEFQRLNVALTRAKRSLIVFANTDCLRASNSADADDISALMADAKARGRIWDEDQVDNFFAPRMPRKRRKKLAVADPTCVDRQPPPALVASQKKRKKTPAPTTSALPGSLQERPKKRKRSAVARKTGSGVAGGEENDLGRPRRTHGSIDSIAFKKDTQALGGEELAGQDMKYLNVVEVGFV